MKEALVGSIVRLDEEASAKRFERLPRWAQTEIDDLKRMVADKERRIEELSSEHPGSNVQISGWIRQPDYTLPPDSQIEFIMGKMPEDVENWGNEITIGHLRNDSGRNALRIQGGRSIIIRPSASNSIEVSLGH